MRLITRPACSTVCIVSLQLTVAIASQLVAGAAPAGEARAPRTHSGARAAAGNAISATHGQEELAPFEAPYVSIVGREANGTAIVRAEYQFQEIETRTQKRVRDGKTIEQVYGLVTPVWETVTVRVPPRTDVSHHLRRLYSQRTGSSGPVVGAASVSRQAGTPTEELLFEIVSRGPDGTANVEIEYTVLQSQVTTQELLQDGKRVEITYMLPVETTIVRTVTVPPGKDILAHLVSDPTAREALSRRWFSTDPRSGQPEVACQITDQHENGTTVVQSEYLTYNEVARTRRAIRKGKAVLQVYNLLVPERQSETVELPPGQKLADYLDERFGSALDTRRTAVPTPQVPSAEEDIPPPPPSVGS